MLISHVVAVVFSQVVVVLNQLKIQLRQGCVDFELKTRPTSSSESSDYQECFIKEL